MIRGSAEWHRAWAELYQAHGEGVDDNEAWQYMGTFQGKHQFRHRAHPQHGRIVVDILEVQ